jgi:hypothetical protein
MIIFLLLQAGVIHPLRSIKGIAINAFQKPTKQAIWKIKQIAHLREGRNLKNL